MTCCVYRQKRRLPCRSLTADAFPGLVLLLDDVGGRRSLDIYGNFADTVFAAIPAAFLDLVLLAGESTVAAMRALLFLARFLLEIICG